jgi:hypothetical protein
MQKLYRLLKAMDVLPSLQICFCSLATMALFFAYVIAHSAEGSSQAEIDGLDCLT